MADSRNAPFNGMSIDGPHILPLDALPGRSKADAPSEEARRLINDVADAWRDFGAASAVSRGMASSERAALKVDQALVHVATLERALAEARHATHQAQGVGIALEQRLVEATAALAEQRAETERLDWFERHPNAVPVLHDVTGWKLRYNFKEYGPVPTFREVVDLARAGTTK